jgi:hypothetical protein
MKKILVAIVLMVIATMCGDVVEAVNCAPGTTQVVYEHHCRSYTEQLPGGGWTPLRYFWFCWLTVICEDEETGKYTTISATLIGHDTGQGGCSGGISRTCP